MKYEEMIDRLKRHQHTAPDVWQGIEDDLDLQAGLSELPSHAAPDGLWDGIESALPTQPVPPRDVMKLRRYLALAGLTILLLSAVIVKLLSTEPQGPVLEYRSEIAEQSSPLAPIQIDRNLEELMAIIEANKNYLDEASLRNYKEQLSDIQAAIDQIMEMQDNYGTDEESIKLLARMERGKADLIKNMMAEL